MIDLEIVDKAFKDYTSKFDMSNEKIALKYEHTFEVARVTEIIGKKMGLVEDDKKLAITIAYLHDIGRFEQIVKTDSFKDSITDHAENGADLLFKRNLIENFKVDKEYYDIIEKAVRLHNKLKLSNDLSEREEFFAKLIRDADKIDIFRVNNKFYKKYFEQMPLKVNLDDFYKHREINVKNTNSKTDALLCQMAFIFDLNFKESIDTLNELGYYKEFIDRVNVKEEYKDLFKELANETFKALGMKG